FLNLNQGTSDLIYIIVLCIFYFANYRQLLQKLQLAEKVLFLYILVKSSKSCYHFHLVKKIVYPTSARFYGRYYIIMLVHRELVVYLFQSIIIPQINNSILILFR